MKILTVLRSGLNPFCISSYLTRHRLHSRHPFGRTFRSVYQSISYYESNHHKLTIHTITRHESTRHNVPERPIPALQCMTGGPKSFISKAPESLTACKYSRKESGLSGSPKSGQE